MIIETDTTRAMNLRNLGVLLDDYELERMKGKRSGLSLLPSGLGRIFDLPSGTGFMFSVMISNDSTARLAPAHITIEPPWPSSRIELLANPRLSLTRPTKKTPEAVHEYGLRRNNYLFPGHSQSYPFDATLNHKIRPGAFIQPSSDIEGVILAIGGIPIPWDHRDNDRTPVVLTIYDHRGLSQQCTVHAAVRRSKKLKELLEDIENPDSDRAQQKRAKLAQHRAQRGFLTTPQFTTPNTQVPVESEGSEVVHEETCA